MADSGEQKETAPRKQSKNPPNFVTLVQLRERWLKKKAEEEEERIRKQQQEELEKKEEEEERERIRKHQQEEREKEEEEERRRKLEVAKELANSEAARRDSGSSSRWRENRSRRTPSCVVATVGFAQVVDEADRDDEEAGRRGKVKEAEELANSESVRRNSGISSHWRRNRSRRAAAAWADVVDGGNEDDEATKRRKEGYRRKKERKKEAKRARAKEKAMEEGKQPVVSEAVSKESEGIEVMMEFQGENDNLGKQISNRGAGIGNSSVPARKHNRNSKVRIGNGEKEGTELEMKEKLGELSIGEENGGAFETKNGDSVNVEKEISKKGAEIGNGSVPARKPQRKNKVNMAFRGKIGNVENDETKLEVKEKLGELSIEEDSGGFQTKNGVNVNVQRQVSKGAEIGHGSVPSRKSQRKSKVNVELPRKISKNAEEEGCKVEIEGELGELSIEEQNGGFETKNGVTDVDGTVPSRKPQRKSKMNREFRRNIGKNVEKAESKLDIQGKLGEHVEEEASKLEIEGYLGELSIEEGNGGFETKNGINDGKYSRGRGRLNGSGRLDECNERRYGRFHGSRGRWNSGRYRGGYESFRMESNEGFKVGVWVRKEDAGFSVEGTMKSSDVLLKETSSN